MNGKRGDDIMQSNMKVIIIHDFRYVFPNPALVGQRYFLLETTSLRLKFMCPRIIYIPCANSTGAGDSHESNIFIPLTANLKPSRLYFM